MHNPIRYAVAGTAFAAVLALSSCGLLGQRSEEPVPDAPAESSDTEEAEEQPEEAAEPAGGGTADFPDPGTELALGEGASFPFDYGDASGEIEVAVTAIEQGDPSELDALELGDQVAGMAPYYIRTTITNVGDSEMSFVSPESLKGILPDGTQADSVSIIGDFAPCPKEDSGDGFVSGSSFETCDVVLANESVEVVGAQFWGDPYGLAADEGLFWMS